MHRIFIKDLLNAREPAAGINVAGWVRSKRTSKAFAFLVLNDGSCQGTLQVIVDAESPAFQLLQGINTGAAVRVRGDLRESPGGGQKWEMQAHEIEVFGDAVPEPILLAQCFACGTSCHKRFMSFSVFGIFIGSTLRFLPLLIAKGLVRCFR
jgi:aspartyl/asparaginyl-tRNA synthetase